MQKMSIATMNDEFEILALNGISGQCLTTAEDGTQQLKENPPPGELPPEEIEAIRQQHETFLTQLEALAVCAIAFGDWSDVYDHINFNAPEDV